MARIIFTTVLIGFILSLDFYVWSAFKTQLIQRPLLKYAFWVITLMTVIFMYYPAINTNMTLYPNYMVIIFGFIFTIIGSKLAMVLPLLIDDLLRLFKYLYQAIFVQKSISLVGQPISRLDFLKNTALGVGALTFSTFAYGILVGRFNFKKHFVDLALKNFPKGAKPLKIVL